MVDDGCAGPVHYFEAGGLGSAAKINLLKPDEVLFIQQADSFNHTAPDAKERAHDQIGRASCRERV